MQVQGFCEAKFLEVKNLFQSYFDKGIEEGASLALVKNGKALVSIYGGYAKNKQNEWSEDTIVNTFSLSKGIYAGCVANLIDQKKLDIEKKISFYWPEFKKSGKELIKVKDLLSHQSGLYRFKTKVTNSDLLDWEKIINILENQEPDHKPGQFTFYHAKTHGYLVAELIKRTTGQTLKKYFEENFNKKFNINFKFGLDKENIENTADLIEDTKETSIDSDAEFNAFNNPKHDVNFYNTLEWRASIVPSMGGHGSALGIAKFYDILSNDLSKNNHNIISKNLFSEILQQSTKMQDLSLNLPIRWTYSGFILRGGWMFGKNKESFGHNGWGGSLGFGDPIEGIGVSYVTKKINSGMGADMRAVNLIKKIYNSI
jgi:CubicO group peptidase (beta-lactamase class C family)